MGIAGAELQKVIASLDAFQILGKTFLFHPLRLVCIEGDQTAYDVVVSSKSHYENNRHDASSRLIDELYSRHDQAHVRDFLADLEALRKEGTISEVPEMEISAPVDLRLDYGILNVTHTCNLRCAYCYAKHGTYGDEPSVMTEQTAKAALDFLIPRFRPNDISIGFFGGEPLLNLSVIQSAVDYCAKASATNDKCRFHVTTNGTLLTKPVCEFLESNGFTMIVSLDGPQQHDAFRS